MGMKHQDSLTQFLTQSKYDSSNNQATGGTKETANSITATYNQFLNNKQTQNSALQC